MKRSTGITRSSCITSIGLALAVLAGSAWAQEQSTAQQQNSKPAHYTVIDLGSLGGPYSEAFFMNNNGAIGGVSSRADGTEHAFLWQEGVMADLGTLGGANSIAYGGPNLSNQLAGESDTAAEDPNGEDFCGFGTHHICHPFLWQPLLFGPGVMLTLPTLGGHNGEANGINDRGEVAGTAENATADTSCPVGQALHQFKPVTWWMGGIRELNTFPGDPDGVAMGTNDNGDVVGGSGDCGAYNANTGLNLLALHALLWKNGTVINLGNLKGNGEGAGILALNVNNGDEVVGESDTLDNASFHAFLWTRETGMQDLGTLHSDDIGSVASGLDDKGNVVGLSIDATFTPHAFLRSNGEAMIDLNTLIPATAPLFLLQACSINSRGEITGLAVENSTGDLHAFLATPSSSEADSDTAANTEQGGSREGRKVVLTENAGNQLQKSLRLRLPGGQPTQPQ
jgi:probable HAF family extracellular repeat protein